MKEAKSNPPTFMRAVFENKKYSKYVIIIGLVGILLIFVTQYLPQSSDTTKTSGEQTMDHYAATLEKKVASTINKIQGVGKSEVMITLSCGPEYIYAQQEKSTTDKTENTDESKYHVAEKGSGETEYILIDTDNGQQALLVTEIAPRVKGVVVVCSGADNEMVAQRVRDAVTTALDISDSQICVTTHY